MLKKVVYVLYCGHKTIGSVSHPLCLCSAKTSIFGIDIAGYSIEMPFEQVESYFFGYDIVLDKALKKQ